MHSPNIDNLSYDKGYENGYYKGYENGYADGYMAGYDKGYLIGMLETRDALEAVNARLRAILDKGEAPKPGE